MNRALEGLKKKQGDKVQKKKKEKREEKREDEDEEREKRYETQVSIIDV